MPDGAADRLDEGPGENREEGEALAQRELIAGEEELAARCRWGRLDHGDLLGLVSGGCVRTTKLPTKEVAYLSRQDAWPKSSCCNMLGYPRAIHH